MGEGEEEGGKEGGRGGEEKEKEGVERGRGGGGESMECWKETHAIQKKGPEKKRSLPPFDDDSRLPFHPTTFHTQHHTLVPSLSFLLPSFSHPNLTLVCRVELSTHPLQKG